MKIPFEITVMLFMILSGIMLITMSLGLSSPKIFDNKKFKPALRIMSVVLFLLLLLTSIFVVEW
jgi:hypothetical protein